MEPLYAILRIYAKSKSVYICKSWGSARQSSLKEVASFWAKAHLSGREAITWEMFNEPIMARHKSANAYSCSPNPPTGPLGMAHLCRFYPARLTYVRRRR
jgi:hypothetical protein